MLIREACDALREAAECLLRAVDGIPAKADEVAQTYYIRQQARSIAAVAADVHLLITNSRLQNVVGLCRVAFESRIGIYAAMRVPDFAAQKLLAQAQGNVRELEEVAQDAANQEVFQQALAHHRRFLQQVRQDYAGVTERTWKIREAAEAAGLQDGYNEHYSMLSKAAHNTPTGLAAKTDPHIVASSVLVLLHDTLQALAALMFFRERDDTRAQPITEAWKEMSPLLDSLLSRYGQMCSRMNELFTTFAADQL